LNTGSRDERQLLADVHRIAGALERIARALEEHQYGATAEEVAAARAELERDAVKP
jgi:DNA-binding FrmR family transcriptional regulator